MPNKKTELILESVETAKLQGTTHKAKTNVVREKACTVTTVEIKTDEDAKKLSRKKGVYVTVEMEKVFEITDEDFESIILTVAKTLRSMIKIQNNQRVLIVGIGNRNVTPDSLGPKCVDRIIVTRGLEKTMPELISKDGFGNVCAINANVFGVTGIESAELIKGITKTISPALVIVVDALATNTVSRLFKTVQISDTSLTPGAGVNNEREEIDPGCPMISIGVPTLMSVSSILQKEGVNVDDFTENLVAIPMNVDLATDLAAKLIAFSLNKVFHYDMQTEEILKFLY